jgi:membrane fusion protein, multidrug efflux system
VAEQIAEQTSRTDRDSHEAEPNDYPRPQSRRRFIILGVIAAVVVIAGLFWWHSTYYEDTDDAQVNGHLIQISSRIAGQIIRVNVDDNQYVPANTVVAEIDPKDFQVAVQQDQAALDSALASYQAATVNVPVTGVNTGSTLRSANADVASSQAQVEQAVRQLESAKAKVAQAEANNTKAQLDLQRYTPLVQRDVISRQQYDAAVATADAQKAGVLDAQASQAAAGEAVRVARERLTQSQAQFKNAQTGPQQVAIQKARADQAAAQVQQARAALEQAKLNLSYTKIVTPVAGIVTRKSVEVSQNVSVGQNMMTLVSLDDIWITANFKETQLKHMRPGQAVSVHVDAYGRRYDGRITQIGGATGSVLSLFPPENATGNFVKVVQRVPVRIDLTNHEQNQDHLLRPGLSVVPKVRVKE